MANHSPVSNDFSISVNGEVVFANGRMPGARGPLEVRCALCDSREIRTVLAMVGDVGTSEVAVYVRTRHQHRATEALRRDQQPAEVIERAQLFQKARHVHQRVGDAVVSGQAFRFTPLVSTQQQTLSCPARCGHRVQVSRRNLVRRYQESDATFIAI